MIRKALDWLGSLRTANDAITSDAVRITALELALRQSQIKSMVWQVKAEDLADKLDAVQPLIEAGRKRKATVAKYREARK